MEEIGTTSDSFNHLVNGVLHSMNHRLDDNSESGITKDNPVGDSLRHDGSNMGQDPQVASVSEAKLPGKDKDPRPKLGPYRPPFLTAKELSSSIIASESTRVLCSLSIALFVVLSFVDYPLLGVNIVNSKSIIALRPVYLLFTAEITVLMAYIVLERQRRSRNWEEDAEVPKGGGVSWDRAEMLLEGGLVAHQTIRAVFIDFSVYVVTVICFLSLVTRI